ncbi:MAG: hypothetical protein C0487_09790 [Leptothrix sp. (in: Bacteria)]|nr:hypothetical protein [Leptothrix sp. (in: b-proteobacteria)]
MTRVERLQITLRSPAFWLFFAALALRGYGFFVSLLLARWSGLQSLGSYSFLLITASSTSTPLSVALANAVTQATAHGQGPDRLRSAWRAARLPLLLCVSISGGLALWLAFGASMGKDASSLGLMAMVPLLLALVVGQFLTQTAQGVCAGDGRPQLMTIPTLVMTALGLVTTMAIMAAHGFLGALLVTALVGIVPALVVWWRTTRKPALSEQALAEAPPPLPVMINLWPYLRRAVPEIGANVLNSLTNWVCFMYLVMQAHGPLGLGFITVGLQWSVVMLLPANSWGGAIMHRLLQAQSKPGGDIDPVIVRQELRRCLRVTLACCVAVLAASPGLAWLYKLELERLFLLLLLNAASALVLSHNFVYERVFVCRQIQNRWLWISGGAYAVQMVLTLAFIETTIYAVAVGNLVALLVVWMASRYELRLGNAYDKTPRRHHHQ